jgi:hypothetical protein
LTIQPIPPAYAVWLPDCTPVTGDLTALGFSEDAAGQAQCQSLESIYNTFNGDSWTSGAQPGPEANDWGEVTHVSTWYGVTHDNPGGAGNVTDIFLPNNNLDGAIDAVDLTGLTGLQAFNLADNFNIGGDIDGLNLTGLTSLQGLSLYTNQIGGSIDMLNLTGLTNLTALRLWANQIGGNIDGLNLTGLSALEMVRLDDNLYIGGSINGLNLTGLTSLQYLNLNNNQIGGNIDAWTTLSAANVPNLEELILNINQIGGNIDGLNLTGLTSLQLIALSDNQIGGNINGLNLTGLINLDRLYLSDNQIGGNIDAWTTLSAANVPNLAYLILFYNQIGGDPSGMLGLPSNELYLYGNQLNGSVPDLQSEAALQVRLCQNPAINPRGGGDPIDTDAESKDQSGWTAASGCPAPNLVATAACNGDDLEVNITAGDNPFVIWGTGPNLPQFGVGVGITTLPGPSSWTGVTVDESAGDLERAILGNFTCPPPVGGGEGRRGAAQVQAPPACDLVIDVEADREVVTSGDRVVWTVLIRNRGSGECQGVRTYGTMPDEFSITDVKTTRGSVNWDGGQYYLVEVGTVYANETVTVSITSLLQGGAGLALPEDVVAAQSAGQQICLTGHITDPLSDTACVTLFPDTLPPTGGRPVKQIPPWVWVVAAGVLITGMAVTRSGGR